ncbi:hypothetical protein [Roseovarius nanhaiticus]|uniref:hypothetical protein n=1 Tax=Roseovarius nanhaiticus TaxID=573024 RepID=UPI00249393B9|nr:hypothetical protein [Roseovarius nanhaiticus]
MNSIKTQADFLRRKSVERTKQQFAELALAGFRRAAYAGVFQKITGTKVPTYVCDLVLDGYPSKITIRVKQTPDTDQKNSPWRYTARIRGLRLARQPTPIALVRNTSQRGKKALSGTFDFGSAQMVLTVLPYRDASGEDLWICVLERPRGDA